MKMTCSGWFKRIQTSIISVILGVSLVVPVTPAAAGGCQAEDGKPSGDCEIKGPIITVLELDKEKYRISDVMRVRVTLENISAKDVYLYSRIDLSEGPNLSVWMFEESGDDVGLNVIPTTSAAPPQSAEDFTKLPSKGKTVIQFRRPVDDFDVKEGRKYDVIAEFHSPTPSTLNFGLPILSKEMGAFTSKPVRIEIIK